MINTSASHSSDLTLTNKNILRSDSQCTITDMSFMGEDPYLKKHRKLQVRYYSPPNTEKASPLILIVPPTGGTNILDRRYAHTFCKKGFRSIILSHWDYLDEESLDPEMHNKGTFRGLIAIKQTLDYFAQDDTPVGVLGASLGAIFLSTYLTQDIRIKAATLIVGGSPLPDVLAFSEQSTLKDLRELRKEKYMLKDDDDYLEWIRPQIKYATESAHPKSPSDKEIFFVLAAKDDVVPYATQLSLLKAWQPHASTKVHTWNHGHFWGIVHTHIRLRTQILRFFEEHLK